MSAAGSSQLVAWFLSVQGRDLGNDPAAAGVRAAIDEALTASAPAIQGISGATPLGQARDTFGAAFFQHLGRALAAQPPASYVYARALLAGAPADAVAAITHWYEHYRQASEHGSATN